MFLSNDNLSSSGSPYSLVHTVFDASLAVAEMDGKDIEDIRVVMQSIIAETEQKERQEAAKEAAKEEGARQVRLAAYRRNPSLAHKQAMEKHPDLAQEGTPLHTEFMIIYKSKREDDPAYFNDLDWPIRLAEESADSLAKKREQDAAP